MTKEEFDDLLALNKIFIKERIELPINNESSVFDVQSVRTNDKFFVDCDRRGRIEFSRFKIQSRYATTKLPLVRIDIDSPPHRNPDGTKTTRNHIHIFKEEMGDLGNLPWAYDLETFDKLKFKNVTNFTEIFLDFCNYCNIETYNVQGVI